MWQASNSAQEMFKLGSSVNLFHDPIENSSWVTQLVYVYPYSDKFSKIQLKYGISPVSWWQNDYLYIEC